MNDQMKPDDTKELLASLDWEVNPDRDLWPDIHSNTRFVEIPKSEHQGLSSMNTGLDNSANEESSAVTVVAKNSVVVKNMVAFKNTPVWLPVSIAACLVMAFGAFIMSSLSYRNSLNAYDMQASFIDYQKSQISLIEQQHAHVRAQFVALLDGDLGPVDPKAATEVRAVLLTIDEASLELKEAILAEPLNRKYSSMLARTYQEELSLLNKFKAKDGQSSNEVSL